MVSETELNSLRLRAQGILKSQACMAIRFKIDNVGIQTFMYAYIADAIYKDQVHIRIGEGRGYDYTSNTITFDSINVDPPIIVHESTHAVIDATHVGKTITVGTHETAAYLAETLYALNSNYNQHIIDDQNIMRSIYKLARKIQNFNSKHQSGLFSCPPDDILYIKRVLEHSALRMNVNREDKMDGIYQGPKQGLIRQLFLESNRNKVNN